ncbi:hypothetical protein N7466_010008 [Penicillium verhagenii]|uniref:uncharacterized protein n=1 Tax=Penicillium verhagenii TaxID=1562060 RepID=UPI0025455750|nr:uncharacterized protein N7466_010008 [Penicillium verhagenii]KAJ5919065.1 hypothetical protein N7466_010008 [Penicillium verhagenii]
MDYVELKQVHALLEEVKTSVKQFEVENSEIARVQALEKSLKLSRALEHPKDVILKLFLSPTQAMVVKIAHDLGLFAILAKSDEPISYQDLANQSGANPLLIERIMRLLVAMDFAQEHGTGKYSPSLLSKEMTDDKSGGIVDTLFVDIAPAVLKTPDFLRKTNYQNPENHSAGPMQYTYDTNLTTFEWLAQDVAVHERFHSFVEHVRESRPFWVDWYPVQERILDGSSCETGDALIVDIAAGSGRDMLAFKKKFPDATGRIIVEDLPAVFNDVTYHDLGLEKIGYDAFTPQPVQGSRAYFLKFLLHEFSDENCMEILKNVTKAMKKGHSKILIEEYILPDENAGLFHSMVDMILMVFAPGTLRTKAKWTAMLESVGLTVNVIFHPDGEGPSIIEAEL